MTEHQPSSAEDPGLGHTPAGSPSGEVDWPRLKELVADALERPPAQRDAFLQHACPEDDGLRARARALLQAHDSATEEFLSVDPLPGSHLVDSAADEDSWVGQSVGGFEVQSVVASGGMGTVYRALQRRTGQVVALKMMRPGLGSSAWTQRFEHEIRVLAQLQHPAIAQIFDAGMHGEGARATPYFAMEFVDGQPLTRFVRDRESTLRERVELMIRVCEGVHHAHQRGIIHRDLKPDNILVRAAAQAEATRDETDPERTAVAWPKIVDFGIARAVDPDQLGATQLTQAGQLIGTMAYMSPEQTTGNPEGIDVRCDVYALGVILFEVLAGTRPYRTDGMTLPDAARQIQEVTPPRLGALDRAFAGDLETIVAVALEKERERRYASASELGADLRRFLDDQPIAARPPSTIYQLRKFARRHRGLVAGVTLAVVALLAGTAGTLWGLLDALEQGRRAKEEATKARSAEATARAAEVTAKTERDHARQAERDARDVSNFMHAVLESADIGVAGRQLSVKEVLDRNAARIDTLFKDRPVARAELHGAFGWDYFTFGDYAAAERHLRLAFELDSSARGRGDPATIEDCTRLCQVLDFAGKVDELGPIIQENVDVALRHLERDHPSTLHARMLLAAWHLGRHDYAPAESLYREIRAAMARTLGSNHDYTLSAINGLGLVLLNTGQYGEAEQLFRQAFEFRQAVHGLEHAKTLVPLINWANALSSEGRHRDAIEKYELVVKVGEKVWGKNHPELLSARGNLASALADGRELVRSRDLNAELYTHYLKTLGPADPDTLRTLNNLCVVLLDLQEFDEAERRVDTLLAAMTKLRGPQHSDTARAISLRAEVLNARIDSLPNSERPAAIRRCRELFARAVAIHEKHIGPRNPDTIIARNSLGAFLRDNKDPEAVKVLARVVADWQAAVPDSPSVLRLFRTSLGKALRQERRFAEAEREMLAAWKLPPHAKASNPELAKQLALLYDAWGKADAAKQWRERAANQGRESDGKAPPQQRGR